MMKGDGSPLQEGPGPLGGMRVGLQLGRYELLHEIATGGMATVYLARARAVAGFERVVAIKVCHPHLRHEEEFSSMFLDEARLAARIHHPNVVSTLDVGEGDSLYLVMDWLEGRDLHQRLAAGLLSLNDTLTVGGRAATALASAHRLGIVHRDVKPSNIFLRDDRPERAVLIDFGLASMPHATPLTQAGMVLGTLGYIAPEQVLRHDASDARTDVFSLGCVLLLHARIAQCA